MASSGKTEEVLLAVDHVRCHREDGTLYLLTERLGWAPTSRDTITLSLRYADMKQQKISPEAKEKVQMQIVMAADDTSHVFQFVNPKNKTAQLEQRSQVVAMLQPLIQKFQRRITNELEQKNRVLASNPMLFQLYKDLVVTGIVTAEEFWASHARELEDAANHGSNRTNKDDRSADYSGQRFGIQAGFLTNLKPQSDEESGGIRYNLTADTIEAIFRTYPSVKQKHAEYVPHSMSEGDFWAHFFQSHYFHRDRLETGKNLFAGDQITMADNQTLASILENDPFVNVLGFVDSETTLAAMAPDASERADPMTGVDPAKAKMGIKQAPGKLTPAHINRMIVQRMNYHSERVLTAQTEGDIPGTSGTNRTGTTRKDPSERVMIGDLVRGEELNLASTRDNATALEIANADAYSFCATYETPEQFVSPKNVGEIVSAFRHQLSSFQPQPHLAFQEGIYCEGAYEAILDEMTSFGGHSHDSNGAANNNNNSGNHPINFANVCGGSFSSALESEYKGLYTALNELLRHFWTCFPVTSPNLEQKLQRMRDTLNSFASGKLKTFEGRLSASGVQQVAQVTNHLHAMLDAANRKYDAWQARKGTR